MSCRHYEWSSSAMCWTCLLFGLNSTVPRLPGSWHSRWYRNTAYCTAHRVGQKVRLMGYNFAAIRHFPGGSVYTEVQWWYLRIQFLAASALSWAWVNRVELRETAWETLQRWQITSFISCSTPESWTRVFPKVVRPSSSSPSIPFGHELWFAQNSIIHCVIDVFICL